MQVPVRPQIYNLTPYSPGKPIEEVQRELGIADVIKLASNENPLGPSPKALAAMQAALANLHLYPDASAFRLRTALASKLGVSMEQIVVGNGSDELLALLGHVILEPGDEIIVPEPSFVRYAAAAILAQATVISVPTDAEMRIDLEAVAAKIGPKTKAIFLANPNNPTGTIYGRAAFDAFIAKVPEHIAVVLDEAYFEFAIHDPDYPSGLEYFKAGRSNIVVLRTLSKGYGLAGIRVGYGIFATELADAIQRVRPPFNVNSIALEGALTALNDEAFLNQTVKHTVAMIEKLNSSLRAVGAKPFESRANFVLAEFNQMVKPLAEALLREGVIVRSGHVLGVPTMMRVSVGTEAEMDRFDAALKKVMSQVGVAR